MYGHVNAYIKSLNYQWYIVILEVVAVFVYARVSARALLKQNFSNYLVYIFYCSGKADVKKDKLLKRNS